MCVDLISRNPHLIRKTKVFTITDVRANRRRVCDYVTNTIYPL